MSNLARKIQEEQLYQQQTQPLEIPQKVKSRKSWLSPGEKILGLAFTGIVCFGAVQMVSNQAAIYEVNKEIQITERAIQEQAKVNGDLEMQVSELSTYERIKAKAEKMGLKFSGNNVKVVED
ncbi:cell division protein FtsL [Bacillus sp. ISL-47]|uniref:cell division protein FtsL n=1 Tax=Bacillus sp. ISL-47 TaxID=2819130 RepID=UPI001BEBBFB7|nr:cell division protein FtsL [Bacillus sp. ISL-47]MBT2687931.1 cell division protein FtsL [Bacillus sp. ISL-47]MBT2708198.1 cell division protein FtsL [Pseudomonas sp. ISL-84]